MLTTNEQNAVWSRHSSQWQKVGAPLRPTTQDADLMLAAVASRLSRWDGEASVAVLGVTPELVQLPWPSHVKLCAFDHSAEMIASVWQAHRSVPSSVTLASWQNLPLPESSLGLVVGDGSLNVLPSLQDYPALLSELDRVLLPEGLVCLRCFIRPDRRESLAAVAADAEEGKILSFHSLKWRIAMSLSEGPEFSVAVADIHAAFGTVFRDRAALAQRSGWPLAVIDTIDAYQGASTRYTFPTLDALAGVCSPYFLIEKVAYGDYELAERCPTLSLRRQGKGG